MKQTILQARRYEGEPVRGSRFIVDLAPVATEAEAQALVRAAAAEFSDASHHCSAWRLASPAIERASDDGEPGGSAGRPMLAQLAGRDLVDTAAVVTRYFGGTKLGVGGLVRAYGGAVGEALDATDLVPWVAMTEVTFSHNYALTDAITRALDDVDGQSIDRTFGELVQQNVRLPVAAVAQLAATLGDLSNGTVTIDDD